MSDLPPPAVILDKSQMAENIGAVARVMANFGLSDLRLVSPRDGWPQERAWATASGADWVLEGVRVFSTVAEAIADLNTVFATTARPRETRQPVRTPRESARILYDDTASGLKTGLLFGGERAGLETTDIALCAGITTIPIDPKHHSLNLAQAVAINAYEWRTLILDAPPPRFRESEPPASNDLLVGLTFAGPQYRPITVMIAEMAGSRGQAWHVLSAGAFVSMIVPLIVFLSLQRFFVRGMLAGGVKG